MMYSQEIYRSTIDTIEDKYMKNCHKMWLPHWKKIRKEMFKKLIELQLKEFAK